MTARPRKEIVLGVAALALVVLLAAAPTTSESPTGRAVHRPAAPGLLPPTTGTSSVHPAPFAWSNGLVTLTLAGASPTFFVSSQTSNSSSLAATVLGFAEVAPNGSAVAFGLLPQGPLSWNLTWSALGGGVQVDLTDSVPVGLTQGPWNGSELPETEGTSLGSPTISVSFHLGNATAGPSAHILTFDLGVTGWPWASAAADALGLVLAAHTVGPNTFTGGSDGVDELANVTGSPVASLTWAANATAKQPDGTVAAARVSSGTSFSPDDQATVVDFLFGGVAGGYSSLFYDPSITLAVLATPIPSSGAGPFSLAGTGGGVVGVGVGTAVVVGFLWAAVRRHRRLPARSDREGNAGVQLASGS